MKMTTNQERHTLGMPQVIIEDTTEVRGWPSTQDLNSITLDSMYRVQNAIYRLFQGCDLREIEANTINPAQQNIFIPLKSWCISLGGCYATVSIHQRFLDGCYAEMETY